MSDLFVSGYDTREIKDAPSHFMCDVSTVPYLRLDDIFVIIERHEPDGVWECCFWAFIMTPLGIGWVYVDPDVDVDV